MNPNKTIDIYWVMLWAALQAADQGLETLYHSRIDGALLPWK